MELERLSVTLRPRNTWEAIDLGVRFAMHHARPLYAAWFAVTLPVAALLLAAFSLWSESLFWAITLMWWLKPAFDRVALYVVSRAVFGETPSVRDTLRALPGLLLHTRLFAALTWQRLAITRSIRLPVDLLEGLRGKPARQRKHLLARRIGSAASWQTLVWFHLETLLWLGMLGAALMLVPDALWPDIDDLLDLLTHSPLWLAWLITLPQLISSLLLEPLYVAGGFMLYLKRRTDLEAWDVELQFRRLARRRQANTAGIAGFLGSIALGLFLFAGNPGEAVAASNAEQRETTISHAANEVEAVMQDPAFGKEETRRSLHWKSEESPPDAEPFNFPQWLSDIVVRVAKVLKTIADAIAALGRVGSWLLILCAVLAILWLLHRVAPALGITQASRPTPAELAGFDIRPQSLPDDLATAALALAKHGDARGALSLLFRGSLSRLAHRHQVTFSRGDTEGDCLSRTRAQAPQRAAYLARLLGNWQRLAYAHQTIPLAEIETLCAGWRQEFERDASGAGR